LILGEFRSPWSLVLAEIELWLRSGILGALGAFLAVWVLLVSRWLRWGERTDFFWREGEGTTV
jgi:hypothetical protein